MYRKKILSVDEAAAAAKQAREDGRRVVFTNGCFDILHVGHVRYLAAARAEGDLLVVGLNSDRSVRKIKGELRPLNNEAERAEVLAALDCVSVVCLFGDPTPAALIGRIAPDVLVKGADWAEKDIVGADSVKSRGGRVVRVPLAPGASTTGLIERVLARFCNGGAP